MIALFEIVVCKFFGARSNGPWLFFKAIGVGYKEGELKLKVVQGPGVSVECESKQSWMDVTIGAGFSHSETALI